MRGEYPKKSWHSTLKLELPPRARRIPFIFNVHNAPFGTTSACAENTTAWRTTADCSRNYLRVRGEYACLPPFFPPSMELPPRARRIRVSPLSPNQDRGTTSACAENTRRAYPRQERHGNYLRVRGEYKPPTSRPPLAMELPPRARRIQHGLIEQASGFGTTSACAENTRHSAWEVPGHGNYLRVRGEYQHFHRFA